MTLRRCVALGVVVCVVGKCKRLLIIKKENVPRVFPFFGKDFPLSFEF